MTNFPPDMDATQDASRLLAQSITGDNAPPMSISQVSNLLKRVVEDQFGHVRLRGEISGYKRAASGHVYLSLKDDKAKIDGIIWRGSAERLAFRPEDGIEVVVTGKLTTYPARSGYQIVIERMELAGEGALMQLFEKLKAKLAGEGLFDAGRKRPLPFLPRTIGVITSPTGAVIRDILHRLSDRCPSHVIVWPVAVQGEGAAGQVANALAGFAALPAPPDLVIVARGGGSIEDLWAFNEEIVVRAVAACPIPVISAVGHETDTTLCDFAADRRAPTPTAAAEMAVPVRAELLATVDELRLRSGRAVRRTLDLARERLANQARHLPKPEQLLQPQAQRVDDLGERLRRGLGLRIAEARGSLAAGAGALRPSLLTGQLQAAQRALAQVRLQPALVIKAVEERRQRLHALWRVAQQLHPDGPLKRGYVRVSSDGVAVTSRVVAAKHPHLLLHFGDGELAVSTSAIAPPRAKVKQPESVQPKLL